MFSLFLMGGALAQPCTNTFFATIKSADKQELAGATVEIPALGLVRSTNDKGQIEIPNLCAKTYEMKFSFVGFKTQFLQISLPAKNAIIILEEEETRLNEVIVTGNTFSRSSAQISSLLTEESLQEEHGKPLGEALKKIAGVSALQTGPSIFKPVIHGLHSQRILILNNGIRQEGQQWGIEHAPEIDPFVARQIEVIKGAEAVRYGADAMGGVIILSPPALHDASGFGGAVSTSFQTNSKTSVVAVNTEGKAGDKWAWQIQTSGKYGGDYQSPTYTLSNTGQRELNFSGGLGYQNSKSNLEFFVSSFNARIGILRAAHTGNLNDLNSSIINKKPWYIRDFTFSVQNPYQQINHHLFKTSYKRTLSANNYLRAIYGLQINNRKEFDIRRAERGSRPSIAMQLISQVFDVSIDHTAHNHKGSYGINTTLKSNTNDTETTGIKPLIPDYRQAAAGLFALEKIKLNKLTLEAGVRADYQYLQVLTFTSANQLIKPTYKFFYLSANAGLQYDIGINTIFTSNLSYTNRPPHVSELFSQGLHHGTATIEEGLQLPNGILNAEEEFFRNERSAKWLSGVSWQRKNFALEASAYANFINNYVFLAPRETRLTIRGYFPVFAYTQTNALLAGLDITFDYTFIKNWKLTGKYSYLYGQDVSARQPLIYMPPIQFDNELTWQLPGIFANAKTYIRARLLSVLQQHRTPPTRTPLSLEGQPAPTETFDFMDAPEAYTLVNAETGFSIPAGENELVLSLACENITNQQYRNYMNRLRYFADDIGRNFIVRLSYNFYAH
jgi:iron complex outermembrane receptor protein